MGNVLILAGDLKNTRKGLCRTQVWNGKSAALKPAKNGLSRGGMEWLLLGKDPFFVIPEGNVNASVEIHTGIYSKELFGKLYQSMVNGRDNGWGGRGPCVVGNAGIQPGLLKYPGQQRCWG